MKPKREYEIRIDEDEIEKNGEEIIYPIRKFLTAYSPEKGPKSHGHLSFAGHELFNSRLLDDIRIYYLYLFGELDDELNREEWADPIRGRILSNLSIPGMSWYIGFCGSITDRILHNFDGTGALPTDDQFLQMDHTQMGIIQSEHWWRRETRSKSFFEISTDIIEEMTPIIWESAIYSYPIEGYLLPSGKFDLLRAWNLRQRDEQLFRDVVDISAMMFFTVPEEHRHFVFLTNKLSYQEYKQKINLESLKRMIPE